MDLGITKNSKHDVKIAVLEQKFIDFTKYVSKLDDAIGKLSEVSSSLSKMLAVHEEKIGNCEKSEDVLLKKIEQMEETNTKEHEAVISKIEILDGKIQELNRFRWVAMGIVTLAIFAFNFVSPIVSTMVTETIIQGNNVEQKN